MVESGHLVTLFALDDCLVLILQVELIRQAHLADKFNDNLESAKRDVDKNAHKVKLLYTRIEEIKEDISKLSQGY